MKEQLFKGGVNNGIQNTVECQTDDVDILDFRITDVRVGEVYQFDRISNNLKKIVIEKGDDLEVLKQYEYIHKNKILRKMYTQRSKTVGSTKNSHGSRL